MYAQLLLVDIKAFDKPGSSPYFQDRKLTLQKANNESQQSDSLARHAFAKLYNWLHVSFLSSVAGFVQ